MSKRIKYFNSIIFAILIVGANYTVQFPINEWLTYGAILYPFTFLLTDILGENFSKNDVLVVVKSGIALAIIPTILIADWRIAFASITTFFLIQQLDVSIFHYLKEKYQDKWWLRNNASTMLSQLFDTTLFFILAFSFVLPFDVIIKLIVGDYMIKLIIAILDTPIFYILAIKLKLFRFKRI
ncbi:queuosine precursor transporter [Malaciobacter marinus]|jgi:hypothetical protein|uniref:queuosine precursor transporter n=1 Tax=Malaciobacter marinus TaxID=505249 RepID=UPI0009A90D74|nr:queuosine precursor transporter [Malaciobacter marinus]SKB49990.1 hypothetical protein SAMN06295997_11546 [Malaciobacter marinus]